jgi:hypothetical protein
VNNGFINLKKITIMETNFLKKHLKKSYDKEDLIKIYEKIENPPAYFLEYLYDSSYREVLIFIIKEYKNFIEKLLKK